MSLPSEPDYKTEKHTHRNETLELKPIKRHLRLYKSRARAMANGTPVHPRFDLEMAKSAA